MNSLSDEVLIMKLYEAAKAGVEIKLIIRGICCMLTQNQKSERRVFAISIVDEYLEHARGFFGIKAMRKFIYLRQIGWYVTWIIG